MPVTTAPSAEHAPRFRRWSATAPALRACQREIFARFEPAAALVTRFEPLGVAPGRAAALADLTISAIEGALVLSRAARSTEPFNTATEALISAIDHDAASQPAAP